MKELYDLKEMLCEKLKEYSKRGDMTASTLDVVDKLAHAVKNIDKIIMSETEEYSEGYRGRVYGDGASYRYPMNYRDGAYEGNYDSGSYARGRGRNARRDSMGRYASEDRYYRAGEDFKSKLHELMADAPDEETRKAIERLAMNA